MRYLLSISLMLFTYCLSSGQEQQRKPLATLTLDQMNTVKTEMKQIMDPEVMVIQPGIKDCDPPSDAIILFNGYDINQEWEAMDGTPTKWIVKDGVLISVKGAGLIKTKRVFADCQLHIEWCTPSEIEGYGQDRGNSGVYLQELYEIQVLDSYNNRTYRNGQAGSIYMQYAPLINASRKPGEWQSFDIIYTAPRFKDNNTYFTPPRITAFHNGVLIQTDISLFGPTNYHGIPEYIIKEHGPGSILLQDHGNPVGYRNIWIREL